MSSAYEYRKNSGVEDDFQEIGAGIDDTITKALRLDFPGIEQGTLETTEGVIKLPFDTLLGIEVMFKSSRHKDHPTVKKYLHNISEAKRHHESKYSLSDALKDVQGFKQYEDIYGPFSSDYGRHTSRLQRLKTSLSLGTALVFIAWIFYLVWTIFSYNARNNIDSCVVPIELEYVQAYYIRELNMMYIISATVTVALFLTNLLGAGAFMYPGGTFNVAVWTSKFACSTYAFVGLIWLSIFVWDSQFNQVVFADICPSMQIDNLGIFMTAVAVHICYIATSSAIVVSILHRTLPKVRNVIRKLMMKPNGTQELVRWLDTTDY